MHIDHIWYQIFKQMVYTLVSLVLNTLQSFLFLINFLFLIPHSNSYCENSTVRKIYTGGRHNLGNDTTKGHESTVFTETICMISDLHGVPIPKINIFGKKLACYEWEPIKCILALAKFTTYKNLQARKKQQQQAVANEDPEN